MAHWHGHVSRDLVYVFSRVPWKQANSLGFYTVSGWPGGSGVPLSGPGGHQNVDVSLVLKAYWHIGMFMFFVIFVPFPEN